MIPADTREGVAAEIMRRAVGFRRGGPHQLYAPEFMPLAVADSTGSAPYVFILRRIEEGADPEVAWAEFAKSLKAFAGESG